MTYEELEAALRQCRRENEEKERRLTTLSLEIGVLRRRLRRAGERRLTDCWVSVLFGAFCAVAVMMVGFLLTRIF